MNTTPAHPTAAAADPASTWSLDREVVLVRVLDAPRQAVFAAWTDADAFCQWFGPDGFTCVVHEMDVRPGGRARFDMTAADGTLYTNRFDYLEVVPGERMVMDHGSDVDDDPSRFRVTLTFDEQAEQFLRAYTWDGKELKQSFSVDFVAEGLGRAHQMRFGAHSLYSDVQTAQR